MVRNCNNVSICIWYEMVIMYRSAYGTKWQWYEMVMVRKWFSLWYEMAGTKYNRQTSSESASHPPLVATSADSVPSSYLVRITIAPIGPTFGNLQWRRYWNNFTFEYSSNNNIFSFVAMSADSIPICICIWYVVEPNYGFYTTGRESADGGLYWRRFLRAVLNASKEFACTTLFGRWFQWITVSTKKECWYCCFL